MRMKFACGEGERTGAKKATIYQLGLALKVRQSDPKDAPPL